MKNPLKLISALLVLFLTPSTLADLLADRQFETRLLSAFGDTQLEWRDYDAQLKEIIVGSKTYFSTHDGQYIFAGPIFDTEASKDIVAAKENTYRLSRLNAQPQSFYLNYPSTLETKYQITVFTDIDCAYCRSMHRHMNEFNQLGISVNYVMYPRTGVNSASYLKTIQVLCSDYPTESVTQAMLGEEVQSGDCEHQLEGYMDLVRELNVRSTPSIVLPNGVLRPGLVNPEQLLALLERD